MATISPSPIIATAVAFGRSCNYIKTGSKVLVTNQLYVQLAVSLKFCMLAFQKKKSVPVFATVNC